MDEVLLESILDKLKACSVAQLGEVCVTLDIQIPPTKTGKQGPIKNIIRNHLTSEDIEESEDNGLALLKAVEKRLNELVGTKKADPVKEEVAEVSKEDKKGVGTSKMSSSEEESAVKKEVKVENGSMMSSSDVNAINVPRYSLTRLRDFKIKGGTVGLEEGSLDYVSLSYQITEGKKLGYSMREIRAGVVDAMKGELRKYFEGNASMTDEDFMGILHSKYEVSNAITIFNEMTDAAQEPTETASKFTVRLMNMRDLIIALGREGNEEVPVDELIARKAFFHTLTIGYMKDTVRLHLHQYLKTEPNDRQLLDEVRKVVTLEKQHEKKKRGGKGSAVNNVNAEVVAVDVEREDKIMSMLMNINTKVEKIDAMDKKINELEKYTKREIAALKSQIAGGTTGDGGNGGADNGGNGGGGQQRNNRNNRNNNRNNRFVKCENCERTNAFCTHCTKCGEEGHKRFQCPLNEE